MKGRFRLYAVASVSALLISWLLALYTESTPFGKQLLRSQYAFFSREDYLSSGEHNGAPLALRLVTLTSQDYENFFAGDVHYTPREKLANAMGNSIRMGARVVLITYSLSHPSPLEEPDMYLESLRQVTNIAREQNAVILIPQNTSCKEQDACADCVRYTAFMRENSDIFVPVPSFISSQYSDIYLTRYFAADASTPGMALSAVLLAKHPDAGHRAILNATKDLMKRKKPSAAFDNTWNRFLLERGNAVFLSRYPLLPFRQEDHYPRSVAEARGAYDEVPYPFSALASMTQIPDGQSFAGKIALIGNAFSEMEKEHPSPEGSLPGVYIVANQITMLLEDRLTRIPGSFATFLYLTSFIGLLVLMSWLGLRLSTLFVSGIALFILLFSMRVFNILPPVHAFVLAVPVYSFCSFCVRLRSCRSLHHLLPWMHSLLIKDKSGL